MPRPKATRTEPALEAVETGADEISTLAEEMQEWYDNLPDNFRDSDKGSTIEQAANDLESPDVESKVADLNAAIEACEGSDEKPGCPPHEVGTRCKVCKWDGASRERPLPVLTVFDPPRPEMVTYANVKAPCWEVTVAEYRNTVWKVWKEHPTPEEIAERLAAAQAWVEAERASVAAWNAANAIPPRRRTVPAVEPLEGFADALGALTVTLPVGKRRPSRSTRLCEAISGIEDGIEALRGLIEAHAEWTEEGRVKAVVEALDELEEAIGELGDVEFPGMYG